MPTFQYTAIDLNGRRIVGDIAGATEQAVLSELEARQLTPVSVAVSAPAFSIGRGVSTRALATAYGQLADLLRAGVPLLRALNLLGRNKAKPRLALVFREIAEAVSEGQELAEGMAERPDIFPSVHVAMVRAGERGGFLEDVLAKLGVFVLREAELKGKIIGNMIYPSVLVSVGAVVLGVVFGFFVPMFEKALDRVEHMPAISVFVFGASKAVTDYGPITLIVLAGIVATFMWARKKPEVQRRFTIVRTYAPLLGPLVRSIAAARFCRMLGTMLTNGIPMLAAMQIAKDAAGNVLMEEAIEAATESVRSGDALAGPLGKSGLFSEDVIEMIAVAESANNLDEVLVTIAETIETQVDRLLNMLVRLIEPAFLLAIALVVGIVAIGLILPMLQMSA